MRKFVCILALSVLCCIPGNAKGGSAAAHLKYGVEWGYSATFFEYHHENYLDPEFGYRIDDEYTKYYLYSNASVFAKLGIELGKHYSATILAGYIGIKQDRRAFPLTLRATYFPVSSSSDGWMIFGEGGLLFHPDSNPLSNIAKLGSGYRMKLSRKSSLDFLMSVQMAGDHPNIYNMDAGGNVPSEYVRRSDGYYGSVNFSLSLNF